MRLLQSLLPRVRNLIVYTPQLEFRYDFRAGRPGTPDDLPSGANFEFPCISDDLAGWSFESGKAEQDAITRYLDTGDRLAVIRYGDSVACRGLVRTHGHLILEGQRKARPLREGEAFIHYCRTATAFTGRRLYPQMLSHILRDMEQQEGINQVTITCREDNVASIKGIERAGFTLRRRLRTIGVLGGRAAFTRYGEVTGNSGAISS